MINSLVALSFLLCLLPNACPEVISIGDQGYPYLYLMDPSMPVIWHEKFFAMRMAMSQAVRVNSRGVRFISADYSSVILRARQQQEKKGSNDEFGSIPADAVSGISEEPAPSTRWVSFNCTPSRDSLCKIQGIETMDTRMFPNFGEQAYVVHGAGDSIPANLQNHLVTRCPESETGRTSGVGIPQLGKKLRWDVSVCNIIGMGGDYVFDPYRSQIFILSRPIPFQMFAVISTLTMVMAIILAHNLEFTLGTVDSPTRTFTSLICMITLLICTIFSSGDRDILLPYVTMEDRLACVSILCYVIYYTVRAVAGSSQASRESPVNPVLATLSMVSLRIYSTLDNPYTSVILFLMITRLFHKISRLERESSTLRMADIFADCILIPIFTYAGFVPQNNDNPVAASLLGLQGAYAGLVLVRVIGTYEKTAR